ncbi:hypothetical protein [Haloarcula amylovorans]|uniref:hypothetical protein n=1 Tax=Haloarcula amylovorans TaxID=2562280 RepID=UPI001076901A|nr:hypothetical protein [Halomicroarcula amylolytica]
MTARFDGSGTNLGSSRAKATTTIEGDAGTGILEIGQPGDGGFGVPGLGGERLDIALLVGIGLLVLAGLGLWLRGGDSDTATTPDTSGQTEPSSNPDTPSLAQQWLAQAQAALANNDSKGATVAAYAAVRERLQRRADIPESLTHREFLTACADRVDTVEMRSLESLAEAYERATFMATSDTSTATAAIEAAQSILADNDDSA